MTLGSFLLCNSLDMNLRLSQNEYVRSFGAHGFILASQTSPGKITNLVVFYYSSTFIYQEHE